jgi:hypothetical protein
VKHGGNPYDRQNCVTLLREIQTAFLPHNLMLTISIGRDREIMEAAYDFEGIYR